MTSRYLRFSAEHVTTTPSWPATCRSDSSRRAVSQSQRSASVRGMPALIFSMLAGGWNCSNNPRQETPSPPESGGGGRGGETTLGATPTLSPSTYENPSWVARY